MSRARYFLLQVIAVAGFFACLGCGNIKGSDFGYMESPRVEVATPASPAEGDIAISFRLTDREVEPADVTVEYSTDGGQTFVSATLTIPADATNLTSAWHPGKTHSVQWDSVADNLALSGDATVCVKVTPSDASNPSGTPGISGSFTVNNIAYNQPPTATVATPAGVQSGNVQINYFLADVESDTCTISVLYSTNDGTSWQVATMGPAGDGTSGLSSSPSGTAHVYLWDSRADNVALSTQVDTVRIRITPTDFNAGTAGDTNSFSVDNSVANDPPTVTITGGPADSSTVTTTQVTFTWSGSDTDGTVTGYYYSFDHDPPDVWTTDTSVTSGVLSEDSHIFRVVAVDDDSDLSTVASRTFTVSPGTITADFTASPITGTAPLDVSFTDLSTATSGIDTWSWDFGNGDTSTSQHPSCSYMSAGRYTVSLTVTGPDGTDPETKTGYIAVISAAPQVWQIFLGGDREDYAESVVQTSDGGYIVAGYSDSEDIPGHIYWNDCYVTKLDAAGSLDWQKIFGGGGSDYAYAIQQTSDGGYIVAGRSLSDDIPDCVNQGLNDCYIVKLGPGGSVEWQKMFGGNRSEAAHSIRQTADGGYVIAGYSGSEDIPGCPLNGVTDAYVAKLDAGGSVEWQKMFGGSDTDRGTSIWFTSDGGYVVSGWSASTDIAGCTNSGLEDFYIMKLNSAGTVQWQKMIGGSQYEKAYSVQQTFDGGYIVAGDSRSTDIPGCANHGENDSYVMKLDTNGVVEWQKMFGGGQGDRAYSVRQTSDGGYVFAGHSSSKDIPGCPGADPSYDDFYLVKLDASGAAQWQKMYGGNYGDYANSVEQTSDGGYVLAGWSGSTNIPGCTDYGLEDFYIVKLDSNGNGP